MYTPADELKSKQHNINAYIAHFSYNGEQRAPKYKLQDTLDIDSMIKLRISKISHNEPISRSVLKVPHKGV